MSIPSRTTRRWWRLPEHVADIAPSPLRLGRDRERADLVLLDVNMPGMNGLEVLKHISDQYPDVPVIMVTALTDDVAVSAAMRDGAYAWLGKPFDINELGHVVDAALNRRPYRTR